ncbi:MAG: C40 family peptidase [Aestuariivirga sp.]|uniref:C40 family peptidase n=1 Tax=Aestuariivirga sp. TaxID=2650926 RepID=UPI0038D029DB
MAAAMTQPDKRLHAYRDDLADAALAGRVEARRFVAPRLMRAIDPVVPVYREPRFDSMQLTQALLGEAVKLFDEREGWAWVQLARDGYVGYVKCNALAAPGLAPSHRVAVPSTFVYPAANLKSQPAQAVPLNAEVTVLDEVGAFSRLSDGRFVFSRHLKPAGVFEPDFVAVAEQFRHVPYLWGGKSVQGLDCSGLVQLSLEAAGAAAPRDSDMQEAALGTPIPRDDFETLRRGDLIFWDGHVGIMTDAKTLLHANGHHMMAVAEPLAEAADRIARRYGPVSGVRRLP